MRLNYRLSLTMGAEWKESAPFDYGSFDNDSEGGVAAEFSVVIASRYIQWYALSKKLASFTLFGVVHCVRFPRTEKGVGNWVVCERDLHRAVGSLYSGGIYDLHLRW